MQVTISVEALRSVVSRAIGVAGNKSGTMPILSTILLEAEDTPEGGLLIARAYDLEIGVQSSIPCDVRKQGSVAVPAKLLADVAKVLPEQVVSLRVGANMSIQIECGAASFTIKGLSHEDFPQLPSTPKKAAWAPVHRDDMLAAIGRVSYAISADESRYNLNGIFFEADENGLALVATDGHRLAVDRIAGAPSYGLTGQGAIVARKAIDELRSLLAEEGDPGELAFTDSSLLYRRPGVLLVARLVDGSFPAWRQVMPQELPEDDRLVVDRAALKDVLRRVLLMVADRGSSVTIWLAPGQLTVSARNADAGEARDSIAVTYSGPAVEVAVNGRYLADLMSAETCIKLAASVTDELSPIVWRPGVGGDTHHVMMPMRK